MGELAGAVPGIAKVGKFAQNPVYNTGLLPAIDGFAYVVAVLAFGHAAAA